MITAFILGGLAIIAIGFVAVHFLTRKKAKPTYVGESEYGIGEPWPHPAKPYIPDPSPSQLPMTNWIEYAGETPAMSFTGFKPLDEPLKNTEADIPARDPANVTEVSIEREFPPIPRKPRKAAKKTAKKAVKKAAKKAVAKVPKKR